MNRSLTHNRVKRILSVFVMIIVFVVTTFMTIEDVQAQGTNYYVGGTDASDSNPGTNTQPFATIQKAATVAIAGSFVNIRTGTYRETITPANTNVTYRPDGGATVVISGLNEVGNSGWTVHSGNIYKKTIALPVTGYNLTISNNTTIAVNQIFKDVSMQFEARWPKISSTADLLDRSKLRGRLATSNWQSNTLTDSDLPDITGGWEGGKIYITGWFISHTSTITSHSGTTIGFSSPQGDLRFHQYYYLTGKLGALTQAKEWHYESGTLYFWQEGGGSPTGVEYKARNWGFDLRGRSNITIKGLQFIGCEPMTGDTNSANTIIDGIKCKYQNHTVLQEGPDVIYYNAKQTGLKLIGPNSVVRNSEFQFAASQCIWLGASCKAENNLITDINYEANYGAGITLWDTTGGQVITRNTIARAGRSAIDFGGSIAFGQHLNMEISYNDVYHFGMLHADVGGMYGARMTDLTGTRIHHNWVHDSKAVKTPVTAYDVGVNSGLYFDQVCGPTTIDHNVLWNNYECDIVNQQWDPERPDAGLTRIYNNTLLTDAGDNQHLAHSYLTAIISPSDIQRNNIYRDDVAIFFATAKPGLGDVENSIMETQNPQFVNEDHGGLKCRLKSDSPAIDAGIVISGITDGSVGIPDIGAYEFGGTDWIPGYSTTGYIPDYYAWEQPIPEPSPPPPPKVKSAIGTITIDDAETGAIENQYEFVGLWETSTPVAAYNQTDHYSNTTDNYYQVKFTGTQVKVYGEKNNTFGIVAISVDDGEETLVDCYSADRMVNTLLYSSPDLSDSGHKIKVRITALKNESSSGNRHAPDRVVIATGIVTVDDVETGTDNFQYEYGGVWAASMPEGAYMKTDHYNNVPDDWYQIKFIGSQVKVYGGKNAPFGIVAISIDCGKETLVDCYSAEKMLNTLLYSSPELSDDIHTVKVRLTGTKNDISSGFWHIADRVVITTGIKDL